MTYPLKNQIPLSIFFVLIMSLFSTAVVSGQEKEPPPRGPEPIFVTPPAAPTEVKLGLFLIGLDKVSPPSSAFPTFDAEMYIDMQWYDERLAFDPAEVGTDQKIFIEHEAELELERIWWPDIGIENGEGVRLTENIELIIFADGLIEYEERFVATVATDFDMRKFPFDEQDLEIDIESFAWDEESIIFTPMEEKTGSEVDHAGFEWLVQEVTTSVHSEEEIRSIHPFSEYIFIVHVERRPGYYLWRIMPMFILIALSWSTFWMTGEPMSGRMGRSFIALLTVVGFHRIISDMMPRISYMTLLDGMVMIAYLFTSITIIENVIVNYYRTQEDHAGALRVDQLARWTVPLSFFILSGIISLIFLG